MRSSTSASIVIAALLPVVTLFGLPAHAAGLTPIGIWKFNEAADASTAVDSSGNGLDAVVGTDVNTGVSPGTRTYYNFPSSGAYGGPNPERLVQVPDKNSLDPGTGTYRVAIAIRTRAAGVNILQKGQSRTYGGFWKIETHNGLATCLFRGGDGQQSGVGSGQRVDDGQWHKIVCTRFPDHVVMSVDGAVTDTRYKASGPISNIKALSIGGKNECGGSVGCDFYIGDIDFVRISSG